MFSDLDLGIEAPKAMFVRESWKQLSLEIRILST